MGNYITPGFNTGPLRIGLTYDLRSTYLSEGYGDLETAEFDREDTIDALAGTLEGLGYGVDCVGHLKNLVSRLEAGDRWDLVFNIAEGMYGFGREAAVPALLDAYRIPYTFSDPLVLAVTLHKGMTKRLIRDLGLPTPDFAEVSEEKELESVTLPYPLFAKPVAEGTGKGITAASKVLNHRELVQACRRIWNEFRQPALIETFLSGAEYTVGIIGSGTESRAVGVIEVKLLTNAESEVYSYLNKENCEELVRYNLATGPEAEVAVEVAMAAWRGLGCRDAGRVDLRGDGQGKPHFMEVNPLAGIHPEHSDLPIICSLAGISYRDLIGQIMDSALKRIPAPETA